MVLPDVALARLGAVLAGAVSLSPPLAQDSVSPPGTAQDSAEEAE